MNERTCIVAVDVGNSAAKLCVQRDPSKPRGESELFDFSVSIRQDDWQQQAIDWVCDHVGCQQTRWRIASVHQAAAKSLATAAQNMAAQSSAAQNTAAQQFSGQSIPNVQIDFISRHDVPMKALVDQPDRLGIDRLLSAFGALNRFGTPLTIVDAGSAVTIDWVNPSGEFCGGAILPGLRMQADALANGTDALPEIDWQSWNCSPAAATNTVDAIRLGLITGVSAAIDRLAVAYGQSAQTDAFVPTLVLTGGDATAISPYVQQPHHVVPHLVCRGVLDLA